MLPQTIVLWMATAAACSPAALKAQVHATSQAAKGHVGVSAAKLESSQRFSVHGGSRFPMQSVYKLPIAMAVLHEVEERKLDLDGNVRVTIEDYVPPALHSPLRDKFPRGGAFSRRELLRRSIVDSDGSASDILLHELGGTREVRRYLKSIGAKDIRVLHTEAQLADDTHAQYEDWAKPDGAVDLLIQLQTGKALNPEHTQLLLDWMKESVTGKDRIRAKLPAGTVVADKTGSSGTFKGLAAATNDIGLITMPDGHPLAIAIFVSDSKANTATRNAVIADIAREVWNCWADAP
jgi:beta-lactamase class A